MSLKLKVISNMIKRVGKLNRNQMLMEIMQNATMQDEIHYQITQKQLYEKGEDGDGVSLGEYSHATVYGTSKYEGKIAKGQRYDHVTLNDTGAFYDSIKVEAGLTSAFIVGDDDKGGNRTLEQIYGNKILTLSYESKAILKPQIAGFLVQKIRQAIRG